MIQDSDMMLVLGCLFLALAVPSLIAAYVDWRRPVVACVLILGGLVMLWDATQNSGRSLSDAPDALFTLIARIY
ncbi:MAG: hypothetical protein N4A70_17545 [Pelagimonas sp.]|jgi:hypothetical protein|nr:hypothetical protein [Pelagimonas sp.]